VQTKLVACGFISADDTTIVDYVRNVDVLFANKRCVELLDQARQLIKSDIHNIVQVMCHLRVKVNYDSVINLEYFYSLVGAGMVVCLERGADPS